MPYNKPLPVTKGVGETFWKGLKKRQFLVQYCSDCKEWVFYPRILCPYCGGENLDYIEHEGTGEVYSYTVVYKPRNTSFKNEVPYIVALVNLDGGKARLMTNIVSCPIENIAVGLKVKIEYTDITDGITLPIFKPL